MNLHLGCGPIHLPGFVNIDSSEHWKPDILMDYLKLHERFEEGSADVVFSCHSIEHLEWPVGVVHFTDQVRRVLKPGGTLRVVVPDLMKVSRKYVGGEDLKDIYGGSHFYGIDHPATRFLYFMREWSHTIIFDESLLSGLLHNAGFVNIRTMPFGVSDDPELCGLDRYESESLSMECRKPLTGGIGQP